MMFKVKVRISVYRGNYVKTEELETMVDADTYRNCQGSVSKKTVEAAWLKSMFPGATKIDIQGIRKI
jgi:hypothetical protein